MQIVGFDWDDGNRIKCQKHGLSISEIESVFHSELSIRPDLKHSESELRYQAIGVTPQRRHVFLVFTIREKSEGRFIRPISARYMHIKEIRHYEKQKES